MADGSVARLTRVVLILSVISLACDRPPPTGLVAPSPPAPPAPLAVRAVVPNTGPANSAVEVRILGTGFQPGATVTLGVAATNVSVISTTFITATTPLHSGATADVVVTNPDGLSATLTAGYTYDVVSLSVSSTVVTAGSAMTVSWVAPGARSAWDWVGLFKIGDPNGIYGWYEYTKGAASGTFELTAPAQPGRYEFRYLLDDGYVDVARSREVTVTALLGASGLR